MQHDSKWLAAIALVAAGCVEASEPVVGLPCEGCEAVFEGIPLSIPATVRIAPVNEPGEPMVVTGRVLGPDAQPRAGVVVYAYHTDTHGIYPKPARSLGRASDRHGRLRGWAVSGPDGRYTFDTIRPAVYPSRDTPAHAHMHVIEHGCATYYIDEIVFTDDPLLTRKEIDRHQENRGGNGITTPVRAGSMQPWRVERDIWLGMNIPGYPKCGARRP